MGSVGMVSQWGRSVFPGRAIGARMINYEDVALEVARVEREARAVVCRKIAALQLGEAWTGLDDRRSEDRGQDHPRRSPLL